MHQTVLPFAVQALHQAARLGTAETDPLIGTPELGDTVARKLGKDHARYGVLPPIEMLVPGQPFHSGWALHAGPRHAADMGVRLWLQARRQAWLAGESFDDHQLTPNYFRQLQAESCPVTGDGLDGNDGMPHAVRLGPDAAWTPGHVVIVSERAAHAMHARAGNGVTASENDIAAVQPDAALTPAEWVRVDALHALVTPTSHAAAAACPLAVLPPNRVQIANAIQSLQVLVTLQLTRPGWAGRVQRIAAWMPAAVRPDFHLFFHTLLPRAYRHDVATGGLPAAKGLHAVSAAALEKAWLDAAVQRRWKRYALAITAEQAQALCARIARDKQQAMSSGIRLAAVPDAASADGRADTVNVPSVRRRAKNVRPAAGRSPERDQRAA